MQEEFVGKVFGSYYRGMVTRCGASTVVFFPVVAFVGVGVTARSSLESVG